MDDKRVFWIGLLIIVVAAAVPRFISYDFSLPYISHPDEPKKHLAGLQVRGLYEFNEYFEYYEAYPPGYVYLTAGTQIIAEPFGVEGGGETIRILRFMSVLTNLLTLVLIGVGAWLAGNKHSVGGWLAAGAWGVSTIVVREGVYAIQDPFVYLWTAVALWTAFVALEDEQRQHWSIWSVVAGILAVVFKYTAVAVLLPGLIVALIYTIRDRSRYQRSLLICVGLIVATGVWLITRYSMLRTTHNVTRSVVSGGFGNLLDPKIVFNNLYHVFVPFDAVPALIIMGLGVVAYIVAKQLKRERVHAAYLGLTLPIILAFPWINATYSTVTATDRIRDVLPATVAALIVFGAAIVQIANLVPQRWRRVSEIGMSLLLAVIIFYPQGTETWKLARKRAPFDRRAALREWANVSLEPGPVVVTDEAHKVFDPTWGGMTGPVFGFTRTELFMDESVDYWMQEHGAVYAVIPRWQVEEMQDDPDGQAVLESLLRLRDFVEPSDLMGPEMMVYRLWRMQFETDVSFGDQIHLVGYDVEGGEPSAGESLQLRFYWQASAPPADNYSLFVHVMPADRVEVLAEADGNPAPPERLPLTWTDPNETLISPLFEIALPPDLPAGDYRVLIGLHNDQTEVRLPVGAADNASDVEGAYQLLTFTVDE